MANYFLQDLLSIRAIREDEASRRVQREKTQAEHARHVAEECERERVEFQKWSHARENSMYASIVRKEVPVRQVLDLRTEVSLMREGELAKEQKVLDAKKALDQARAALAEAQTAQMAASRNLQKIEEHRDLWLEQWEKEQTLLSEREMEDLHLQRVEFDDEKEDGDDEEESPNKDEW